MRVLYLCLDRGIPIGGMRGASIHVEELLTALEADGHQTAVLARWVVSRSGKRPVLLAQAKDLWSRNVLPTLRRDLSEMAARDSFRGSVQRAISGFRPTVVYERYALFRTEGRIESRMARVPHVLEVNAPLVDQELRFGTLALARRARRVESRLWREANLVVVPSDAMVSRVREVGQKHVLVVPNAVDPDVFRPLAEGATVRGRLGLEGRFVIAFAGGLNPWHDLRTLVRAVATLPPELNPSLLVLGEGPDRPELESQIRSLGVDARLIGPVPHRDVPAYLSAADAAVASLSADPGLDYFSPLKAMEYLACGVPTVVADVGSLRAFTESSAALGYPPGRADDLAARLRELATDEHLRTRLSEAGPALAARRTWREAAGTIALAMEKLRRPPDRRTGSRITRKAADGGAR